MTDPNATKRTRIRRDPTEGVLNALKRMNPDALDKLGADLAKAAPKSARLLGEAIYAAQPDRVSGIALRDDPAKGRPV